MLIFQNSEVEFDHVKKDGTIVYADVNINEKPFNYVGFQVFYEDGMEFIKSTGWIMKSDDFIMKYSTSFMNDELEEHIKHIQAEVVEFEDHEPNEKLEKAVKNYEKFLSLSTSEEDCSIEHLINQLKTKDPSEFRIKDFNDLHEILKSVYASAESLY